MAKIILVITTILVVIMLFIKYRELFIVRNDTKRRIKEIEENSKKLHRELEKHKKDVLLYEELVMKHVTRNLEPKKLKELENLYAKKIKIYQDFHNDIEQSTNQTEQIITVKEKLISDFVKVKVIDNKIKPNVVKDLLSKKIRSCFCALILNIGCLLVFFAINSWSTINIKTEVIICLCSLIFCMLIFNLLTIYRISKGYYGTNYEEAKELIYLFKEDSNKNGKNTGKKIFNDINDPVNEEDIVPVPVPVPVPTPR